MKASTLIIIVLLGVIAYSLLTGGRVSTVSAPTSEKAAAPSTPAAPRTPTPKVTAFVLKHADPGDYEAAQKRLEESLHKFSVHEIHATVVRHLPTGHLLMSGAAFDPKVRVANTDTFTLFGVPDADLIADGEGIDCYARVLEPMQVGGSTLYEFIYVPPGNRKLPRFNAHAPVPKVTPIPKPGSWMFEPGRTSLQR